MQTEFSSERSNGSQKRVNLEELADKIDSGRYFEFLTHLKNKNKRGKGKRNILESRMVTPNMVTPLIKKKVSSIFNNLEKEQKWIK